MAPVISRTPHPGHAAIGALQDVVSLVWVALVRTPLSFDVTTVVAMCHLIAQYQGMSKERLKAWCVFVWLRGVSGVGEMLKGHTSTCSCSSRSFLPHFATVLLFSLPCHPAVVPLLRFGDMPTCILQYLACFSSLCMWCPRSFACWFAVCINLFIFIHCVSLPFI